MQTKIQHVTDIQEFKSIEIPLREKIPIFLLGKAKEKKQKHQDVLDSLLKSCLPVIWNYQDIFLTSNTDDIIDYIPEGINDAATVSLKTGGQILFVNTLLSFV